ncbi:nucleoside transporter-domain-containing protein [Phaeosphaeriaceae sp. PMI808]|nr:nucleoside transporter-domain-containing protein [Phaeosphaeriaceae sp. PMI808]
MERLRNVFGRDTPEQAYEPLEGSPEHLDGDQIEDSEDQKFSWTAYAVFLLLGVAMLWSWNMFLAAAPYFQRRFKSNDNLLRNFQSAILSVSTVGNLGSMIVLTKMQANANYPKRITTSLGLYAVIFTFLALSTKLFLSISAGIYFAFLMVMVLSASLATGMCQNGVFAYVSGFGREEYTQAIMTGQGIAGVLPAVTQIISVLSVTKTQRVDGKPPQTSSTSAFAYFLTATLVSLLTLVAFIHLLSTPGPKHRAQQTIHHDPDDLASSTLSLRKPVPLTRLLKKLIWLASAVAITFAITMFFPVFTSQIISVRDPISAPRLFHPATFIPLGFFFWNLGDLIGRTGPALPALRLTHRPRLIFCLSIARLLFVPLYFLCNIGGKGATVKSDFFYLFVVQLFFGMTNGYLGSSCMMGFAEYVEPEEREAAGGFMSLCLVGGLTVGSFLSFAVSSQV